MTSSDVEPDRNRANASGSDVSGKSVVSSSVSVGGLTLVSRVFGLVRDVVFANFIGAGPAADAFFVAFKIPNFFRRLFAEGAFNQAFVPVLSDYKQNYSPDKVRYLVARVAGTLATIIFGFVLLVLLAPQVLSIPFALGYFFGQEPDDPLKYAYVTDMLRLTFPYLLLISLTALSGAVLNTYDRFAVPAMTPVFLNICLILAAFFIAPQMSVPAYGLAWGVLAAGAVQLAFQLPALRRIHMLSMPKWGWSDPGVKRILTLMLPAMFGVSVSQINLLLDTLLAVFLPTGSVSWLYYSDRLSELPLGVFGIAIATVILPNLSKQHFSNSIERFSAVLDWALRMVLLIGLPAAVALLLLAKPILATLFFYGDFSVKDLSMSALSLQAYGVGLLGFMLIKVLAPAYFAREDMKTPVRIAVTAMLVNMGLNVIFVLWLHSQYRIGHVGLAAATTMSAFLNAYLLLRGLSRTKVYVAQPKWAAFTVRLVFALGLMAIVVVSLLSFWTGWIDWSIWDRAWRLTFICLSGAASYFLALFVGGMRLRDIRPRDC